MDKLIDMYQLTLNASDASLDVTEGYTTHNSSYTKAHSTGNIFRSANDTLRDIFPSGPSVTALHPSELKRTHTQSEQEYDSDGGAVHDDDTKMHLIIPKYDQASMGFNRPIKALRKPRRTMLTTRSLPGDSFGFGNSVETFMGGGALKELEEEDWSIPTIQPESSSHITPESSDNDQPSQVEPMILT